MQTDASAEPPEEDPWLGTLLEGRYAIERVLGAGGMGVAYLAQDRRLERPVVVKRPHGSLLVERGFRQRFAKEVSHLSRLDHPHVLRVLDSGAATDGTPYAVFPFLSGGSLRERLDRAPALPAVSELRAWLPQIASALDYVHSEGFVHRDVKPGNVLFDSRGHAYLADFGLSKSLTGSETALTNTGSTPGSPEYMGPEVVTGGAATPRYDQYALGVVVYEALAKRLPHQGGSALEVLIEKRSKPATPLAETRSDLPASVTLAVMRSLERDPAQRHPTCTDLVLQVDPESGLVPLLPRPDTRFVEIPALPVGTIPTAKSWRRWALAGALGASLAGGGWWLGSKGPAPATTGGSGGGPEASPVAALPRGLVVEAPEKGQKVLPDELLLVRGRVNSPAPDDLLMVDGVLTAFRASGFFETSVRPGMEPATEIRITLGPEGAAQPLTLVRTLEPQRPAPGEVPRWARVSWTQLEAARRHDVPVAFQDDMGLSFVLVPEGEFLMGSPEDEPGRQREVEQQHRVHLTKPYYIQATEITNGQARAFRPTVTAMKHMGRPLGLDIQPMLVLDHPAALQLAAWHARRTGLTLRLPTEAEWERAARGGALGRRWWGDAFEGVEQRANLGERASLRAHPTWQSDMRHDDQCSESAPVGAFEANAFGLWHALGNASEWCLDTVDAFLAASVQDPLVQRPGSDVVMRGGDWTMGLEDWTRLAGRGWATAAGGLENGQNLLHRVGSRLVCEVPTDRARLRPTIALECPIEGQRVLRRETLVVRGRVRDLKEGEVVRVDGRVLEHDDEGFETTVVIGETATHEVQITVGPTEGEPRARIQRTLEVLDPAAHGVPPWARVSWWQVEEAKRLGVAVAFENEFGMRFVLIPPGQFLMGSPPSEADRNANERLSRVRLARGFYLQATEVTNGQYRQFHIWKYVDVKGVAGALFDGERQPLVSGRRSDFETFAAWLSEKDRQHAYGLPTGAQWEYAARAGTRGARPWGSGLPPEAHANLADRTALEVYADWTVEPWSDGYATTSPVASFAPNAWGLHDMIGNAGEFVAGTFEAGDARATIDPPPSTTGGRLVVRGGAYNCELAYSRSAFQDVHPADFANPMTGVRLVADLPVPGP